MNKTNDFNTLTKKNGKEGNTLWRLYMGLSATKQQELRQSFNCLGLNWHNFYVTDSLASKAMWDIPLRRLKVYESFFGVDLTSHRLKLPGEFTGVEGKLDIDLDAESMMLAETA